MHKTMAVDLAEMKFPSEAYSEEEKIVTRRCTSFSEAAIMIANDPKTLGITDFFKWFIMDLLKIPPFGLYTMMRIPIMRTPSNSILILRRLMKMPQKA